MSLVHYIIRRLLLTVPVLLALMLIVFSVLHMAPGDAAQIMAGPAASEDQIQRLRVALGLDQPAHVQFYRYLIGVLRGDLGRSLMAHRAVTTELRSTFPDTLELALAAMIWSVTVAVPLGAVAAVHRNTWKDKAAMVVSMLGVSLPVFWIGLVLMWAFAVKLHWFPISGRAGPFWTWEGFRSLVLPALTLGAWQMAAVARLTRTVMLQVLREDFVRTARAKGLAERTVVFRHVLRPAIIPVVTVIGVQLGIMLGGAVVTETIFNWPGMGRMTVTAILNRDFPLAQGGLLVFGLCVAVINLVVDVLYAFLDPRVVYS